MTSGCLIGVETTGVTGNTVAVSSAERPNACRIQGDPPSLVRYHGEPGNYSRHATTYAASMPPRPVRLRVSSPTPSRSPILLPVLFLSFFLSQSHLFAEKVTRFRVVSFLFSRVKAGAHIGMVSIEYFPGEAVSRAIDPPSIGGGRVIHHFEAERQEAR